MLDVQNAPATPAVIRRDDYRPPDWQVPDLALDFDLDAAATRIRATQGDRKTAFAVSQALYDLGAFVFFKDHVLPYKTNVGHSILYIFRNVIIS